MSARNNLPVAWLITRSKLLSARANIFVLGTFFTLLAVIWAKGAYVFSFRLFLFLFPYLFLFLAQDIFKDEVDSGALENLLFAGGGFRNYLECKNGIITGAALGMGLTLFTAYSLYGCVIRQFSAVLALQFAAGILAGLYYQSLAGFLGVFLKAGSNALVIILGQALAFFCLLLSAARKPEWFERLASFFLSGPAAKLEVLGLAALFPNIIVVWQSWWSFLSVGLLAGLFFGLQRLWIRTLELRK